MTRLGVAAALVAGRWVRGDVEVEHGTVRGVGLSPAVGTRVVVSGFVEHQINGFAGVDFGRADDEDYHRVAEALPATGVTAFRPTLYSLPFDDYHAALEVIARVRSRPPVGARILGAHLEGPFLAPAWLGAHDATTFLAPDVALVAALVAAGPVGLVTLAPELPGALEVISWLVSQGVVVSVGHTDATAEECRAAFDAGATMITHCYNAHRRFAPRDPGPLAAALNDERVAVGLIADGIHVADEALRLVARAAPQRMVLVTDAIAAAGCDPAAWNGRGSAVTVVDGAARLADGTLAGSVATMDRCVRKMISLGVPSEVVLAAAGGDRLRPGRAVDLVVLDDAWRVVEVHLI